MAKTYTIISNYSFYKLIKEVQDYIDKYDYEPLGGVAISSDQGGERFFQTMIKIKKE